MSASGRRNVERPQVLSLKQAWYLEKLRQAGTPSNQIEIVEEPVEGEGPVAVLITFPGLYLTLSVSGEILRTDTVAQWNKDHKQ